MARPGREVWRGGSAGLAFVGAFEAPRDVPLRYRFAPTPARLLRMKLTKNDDTYYWSIAEMRVWDRNMAEPDTTDKRSTNPLGIIVALGALGVLLVLLFFNSSPSTDLPPDQGPMAMALVSNMMTNGVLVDYDCARNTAWVNRAVWTKYNFEQRRNMLIGLATVCDTQARRLSHIHH